MMTLEERRAETALAPARRAMQGLWAQGLKLHRAWIRLRARTELHALSDRTLKDIGLSRDEIDSLFR